jgi:hypothetical protein
MEVVAPCSLFHRAVRHNVSRMLRRKYEYIGVVSTAMYSNQVLLDYRSLYPACDIIQTVVNSRVNTLIIY